MLGNIFRHRDCCAGAHRHAAQGAERRRHADPFGAGERDVRHQGTKGNVDFQLMGRWVAGDLRFLYRRRPVRAYRASWPGADDPVRGAKNTAGVDPGLDGDRRASFYKFVSTALVWPLMIGLGMLRRAAGKRGCGVLGRLCGGLRLGGAVDGVGQLPDCALPGRCSRWMAIVTCRSQPACGTGDVAILSWRPTAAG